MLIGLRCVAAPSKKKIQGYVSSGSHLFACDVPAVATSGSTPINTFPQNVEVLSQVRCGGSTTYINYDSGVPALQMYVGRTLSLYNVHLSIYIYLHLNLQSTILQWPSQLRLSKRLLFLHKKKGQKRGCSVAYTSPTVPQDVFLMLMLMLFDSYTGVVLSSSSSSSCSCCSLYYC